MQKVFELPAPVMTAVTARIKILARMDVAEKRRPQDGRIKTRSSSGREVELRISNMPTAFGEKVVMRIFDPDLVVKDFAQLGFRSEEHTSELQSLMRISYAVFCLKTTQTTPHTTHRDSPI